MQGITKNTLAFAVGLSMLAGCIDAIGFMQLGGYFVSFMSGNSTRLAVGLQHGNWQATGTLLAIIVCFVTGAAIGAALRNRAASQRKAASVLTLVLALLVIAAGSDSFGMRFTAMLVIAAAMGAENSILESNGDHVIGVTYMTGTLVKIGQRIAGAFQGGDRFSWSPYFLLWLGLIVGGVAGSFLFVQNGFNALWFPAAWAGVLTVLKWKKS